MNTSADYPSDDVTFCDMAFDTESSFYTTIPATIAAGANDIQSKVLDSRALELLAFA